MDPVRAPGVVGAIGGGREPDPNAPNRNDLNVDPNRILYTGGMTQPPAPTEPTDPTAPPPATTGTIVNPDGTTMVVTTRDPGVIGGQRDPNLVDPNAPTINMSYDPNKIMIGGGVHQPPEPTPPPTEPQYPTIPQDPVGFGPDGEPIYMEIAAAPPPPPAPAPQPVEPTPVEPPVVVLPPITQPPLSVQPIETPVPAEPLPQPIEPLPVVPKPIDLPTVAQAPAEPTMDGFFNQVAAAINVVKPIAAATGQTVGVALPPPPSPAIPPSIVKPPAEPPVEPPVVTPPPAEPPVEPTPAPASETMQKIDQMIDQLLNTDEEISIEDLEDLIAKIQTLIHQRQKKLNKDISADCEKIRDLHLKHTVSALKGPAVFYITLGSGVLQLATGLTGVAPKATFTSADKVNRGIKRISRGRVNHIIDLSASDISNPGEAVKTISSALQGSAAMSGSVQSVADNRKHTITTEHNSKEGSAKQKLTALDNENQTQGQKVDDAKRNRGAREDARRAARKGIFGF